MGNKSATLGPHIVGPKPSLRRSAHLFYNGRAADLLVPQGNSNPDCACDYWWLLVLVGTAELRWVPI